MPGLDLERVTSVGGHDIGYPHGHLGYLTPDEQKSFVEFKGFLKEKGLYTPPADGKPASHDDATLLYVSCHFRALDILGFGLC